MESNSYVIVVIDFGSSQIRVLYKDDARQLAPELLTFPPYVLPVKESTINSLREYPFGYQASSPENYAWLKVDNQAYLVGELAKREMRSQRCLEERKFIAAQPITLAAIGSIARILQVGTSTELNTSIELNLGILLPWNEYKDGSQFEGYIRESLSCFEFQGIEYRVRVDNFECHPEGTGILAKGRQVKPGRSVSPAKLNILVVVIGYRNLSVLFLEKGRPRGMTAFYGMSWMVERVQQLTSHYEDEKLVEAISKAGSTINQRALEPLVRKLPYSIQANELKRLKDAISVARAEYFNVVSQWLGKHLTPDFDEVMVTGGTFNALSYQFIPLLKKLTKRTPTYGQGLEQRILERFGSTIKDLSLQSRLTDVYGYFYWVDGSSLPELKNKGVNAKLAKVKP